MRWCSAVTRKAIQALDRTQPGLPLKPGRAATMTHDYKRNGTTSQFAALNAAEGKVIGLCPQHHRRQEWIKFFRHIDLATPPAGYCTSSSTTTPPISIPGSGAGCSSAHVFTPTGASWLNMVERFFRDITHNRIRRGVFPGAPLQRRALPRVGVARQVTRPFSVTPLPSLL